MTKGGYYTVDYRAPVLWGVVLYCGNSTAHGTILNVTPHAWEIAGSMVVQPNMTLKIRLWPVSSCYLEIEEAKVLWVREKRFGVALTRIRPRDQEAIFALEQHNFGLSPIANEELRFS
jgi:hypothetical protein